MNLKQIMSMDPVPPPDKPIPIHLANQALYLNRGESSSVFNKATSSINFLNQLYQFLPPNVVKHLQGLDNEATPTKKVGDEFVIDEQKKQEMKRNLDTPDAIYATDYERAWWDSNDRAWTHEPDQYRIDRSSTYYGGAHSFANQFNKSLIINFSRKPHLVEGAQSFFFNNISASSGVRGAETWSAFKRDGEAPSAHRSQSTFQFLNSSYWTNLNAVLGRPDEELTFNNVAPTASDSWGLIGTKLKNRHEGFQQATADGGNTHKLSKSITETKKKW